MQKDLVEKSNDEVYLKHSKITEETKSASCVVRNPRFVHNVKATMKEDIGKEINESEAMIRMVQQSSLPVGKKILSDLVIHFHLVCGSWT